MNQPFTRAREERGGVKRVKCRQNSGSGTHVKAVEHKKQAWVSVPPEMLFIARYNLAWGYKGHFQLPFRQREGKDKKMLNEREYLAARHCSM